MKDLFWPLTAFASYLIGGVLVFAGAVLVLLLREADLWGWGDGRAIGYLLVSVGLVLCILGVLTMRIIRNRF